MDLIAKCFIIPNGCAHRARRARTEIQSTVYSFGRERYSSTFKAFSSPDKLTAATTISLASHYGHSNQVNQCRVTANYPNPTKYKRKGKMLSCGKFSESNFDH